MADLAQAEGAVAGDTSVSSVGIIKAKARLAAAHAHGAKSCSARSEIPTDSLPTGLKDVSQYPNLIYVLLKRGYTESDVEKICSGNVFRVWRRVAKGG